MEESALGFGCEAVLAYEGGFMALGVYADHGALVAINAFRAVFYWLAHRCEKNIKLREKREVFESERKLRENELTGVGERRGSMEMVEIIIAKKDVFLNYAICG